MRFGLLAANLICTVRFGCWWVTRIKNPINLSLSIYVTRRQRPTMGYFASSAVQRLSVSTSLNSKAAGLGRKQCPEVLTSSPALPISLLVNYGENWTFRWRSSVVILAERGSKRGCLVNLLKLLLNLKNTIATKSLIITKRSRHGMMLTNVLNTRKHSPPGKRKRRKAKKLDENLASRRRLNLASMFRARSTTVLFTPWRRTGYEDLFGTKVKATPSTFRKSTAIA